MKPATKTEWRLRHKLRALAERGVGGEREAARKKLEALEERFDFTPIDAAEGLDLLAGAFRRSESAQFLMRFDCMDLGGFVKWAIENRAKIPCVWRNGCEVWAQAEKETVAQLAQIAGVIVSNFNALWSEFASAPGIDGKERRNFMLGLYDGMTSDAWQAGKPLPAIVRPKVKKERRKRALSGMGLELNPYHVALSLGARIRIMTPISDIVEMLKGEIAQLAA